MPTIQRGTGRRAPYAYGAQSLKTPRTPGAYQYGAGQARGARPKDASPKGKPKGNRSKPSSSNRLAVALGILGLIVGACLVAYPYVSDFLYKQEQARVMAAQEETVEETSGDELAELMEAALDYNERLLNSRVVVTDPFDPSNQVVSTEDYYAQLNLAGNGVMGSIDIPKINAAVPIYHGTSDDVLQNGAGHLSATSLPVGGESSHCVLAGHNGLPSVQIFDDIDKLEVGDYFVIKVLGEDHAYRVTSTEVVEPDETDSLRVTEGKDLVTLITCTPYGINTHRLLVHAERCAVPDEYYSVKRNDSAATAVAEEAILPLTLAGSAVAAGILAAAFFARGRKRQEALRHGKHFRSTSRQRLR